MIITKPEYYKSFQCIAGDCPDSCCQGWEVDADADSLAYYETLDASLPIKKRIDSVLDRDEFGNTIFALARHKRCPFLNDENLCDMHIAIGGEHTPYTCRTFPRFIYDFGGTREIGISFSCPVAAELIYNHKSHLLFEQEANGDLPTLNDIDALTYIKLSKARNEAYKIAQNDALTIRQRVLSLLDFAVELQTELDEMKPFEETQSIISDNKLYVPKYKEADENISFFEVFNNPELINEQWQEKIKNPNLKAIENKIYNEQIIMYFIYKYFLQAVYDYDVLSKVKMAAVGVLINTYFGEDSWTMHLWSKETEHSQYNMDRYKNLLLKAKCLRADALKKRLEEM